MPVCQGCGKSCDTDLCCPNCADFERSSFFCSQECFGSNWTEHSKLHSILRQQRRMTEMENREKRMRGMSAANEAVNAIRQMISSVTHLDKRRVSVSSNSAALAEEGDGQLKGHQLTVVDKVVSGVPSRTGRVLIVVFALIVILIFAKIHFLISEIPVAVERKVKVNDALSIQTGGGAGAFVAPVRSAADMETTHVPSVDDARLIKNLRGEIDGLKSELESYKKMVDELRQASELSSSSKSNSTETMDVSTIQKPEEVIGGVRIEEPSELSTGPGVVHVQYPSENIRALGQVVGIVREQN